MKIPRRFEMPLRKYTSSQKRSALRLYKAGMKTEPIEELTGVKEGTIHKLARDAGVVRPRSESSLTEKQKKEAENLYDKSEYSCPKIAKILEVSEHAVYYHIKNKGLTRTPAEAKRAKYKTTKMKAHKLVKKGLKLKVVGKRVGVHPRTVGIWKKEYNWER